MSDKSNEPFIGRIYIIRTLPEEGEEEEICYIGSTKLTLDHRLASHICSYYSKSKMRCSSGKIFSSGQNYGIYLLEEKTFTDIEEMLLLENRYMLQFPNRVNKRASILDDTAKDTAHNRYEKKNREARKEAKRAWYYKNKEKKRLTQSQVTVKIEEKEQDEEQIQKIDPKELVPVELVEDDYDI